MKDELREFVPDDSSRKSATDWLMKVISAKGPVSFHLNGSEDREVQVGNAVAVEEMTHEQEPRETARWAGEFTAEDLCGTPAVPVIKVTPVAKDEISADDVCWVPEDRRLKPQPVAAAEAAPAPKLHIVQTSGRDRQEKVQEPEVRAAEAGEMPVAEPDGAGARLEAAAETMPAPFAATPELANGASPLSFQGTQEAVITAADISREPAPRLVEPIWGAFVDHRQDAGTETDAVTAADISRDWVLQQMTGPDAVGVPSSFDLPSSFKVLKSTARAAAESLPVTPAAAPAVQAVAPTVAEAAAPNAEAVAPSSMEATETVLAPNPAVAPEGVVEVTVAAERPDTADIAETAAADKTEQQQVDTAAPLEGAVTGESEIPAVEIQGTVASEEPSAEMTAEAGAAVAESDEADLREIEAALAEAEAAPLQLEPEFEAERVEAAESGVGAEAKAGESVFAREGFWGNATRGEAAAQGDGLYEKPLVRDLRRASPIPEDAADIEKPPEGWMSAWKTLLQLGSVLPWVARALPAMEAGAAEPGSAGPTGSGGAGIAQETRQDVAGLRLVQYEIRTTVQDHSMQLKRMEEQLARVRESVEAKSSDSEDMAENVQSAMKLARIVGIGLGGLLVVLIVLVAMVLAHGR